MTSKVCSKCKENKQVSEFHKAKKEKSGLKSHCKECRKVESKKRYEKNPEYFSNWIKQDKDKNPEKYKKLRRDSYLRNREKELKSCAAWAKNNRHKVNAVAAKCRLIGRKYDLQDLYRNDIYAIYRRCTKGNEIDHIIPIKHDNICGLHVPWNLQILSRKENRSKGSKFDGTYENNSWRTERKYGVEDGLE